MAASTGVTHLAPAPQMAHGASPAGIPQAVGAAGLAGAHSTAGITPMAPASALGSTAPVSTAPAFFGRANIRPNATQSDKANLTPQFLSGLGGEGVNVRDSVEKQMWSDNWKEQSSRVGTHQSKQVGEDLRAHAAMPSDPNDPKNGDNRELEQLLRTLRGLEGAGPEALAAAERQQLEQGLSGKRNDPGRRTPQSPGSAGSFLRERAKETVEMRGQIQDIMKQNSRIFKVLERHGIFKGNGKKSGRQNSGRRRSASELEEGAQKNAACDGCQPCW
eukprot:gnl/MRDRNA2_/MRDRNA2_175698_c0_seq1.p1 gnl/MRDRNA2_/MRDRNA2_175698_c0~~gnl/MRDRNA2_/MRDRNA2_175698_c0_seq1.p1  ORF type:complete len:320 (+),score=77.63 gnl/MRDRNA2_/MRDRNA2_175698_c0_seq1:138-962(+)